MEEVVDKLIVFGKTLGDENTSERKKLKILKTLDEIDFNLVELSNSGIGKAVKKLKKEPNDIGVLAKALVLKWKKLLEQHIAQENVSVSEIKETIPKIEKAKDVPKKKIKFDQYTNKINKVPKPTNCDEAKTPTKKDDSIDASSGMSFMDCLNVKPVKPKATKRKSTNNPLRNEISSQEIISSIDEVVNTRDTGYNHSSKTFSDEDDDDEFQDGNLKFKSQKVIYAPRTIKKPLNCINNSPLKVPFLIDLCTNVLSTHISQVDHVGSLPWEIFEKALASATIQDLSRIEKFNPQFKNCMPHLWKKHVDRDFPSVNWDKLVRDNIGVPHGSLYAKLQEEHDRRLNKFINKTSGRVKAEKEAQRTTITTDVIIPHKIRRSAYPSQSTSFRRPGGGGGGSSSGPKRSSSSKSSEPFFFKPKNMSHPNGTSGLVPPSSYDRKPSASRPVSSGSGLLSKLRRKLN